MCIQYDCNVEAVAALYHPLQLLEVGHVVLSSYGFDALPCDVQSNYVHAPFDEILEVKVGEGLQGVKPILYLRVEGEYLIHYIHT